jgi:ankyrin repeat protein
MVAKKETTLELCDRVTTQGNSISIRMLEYLSSPKHQVHGFQSLASEFLDLFRNVWYIQAGLTTANRKREPLPSDMTQVLDKQFRQINDELIVLNQMVTKFVDNDKKGGGLGKKFRMMFADSDVDKMRSTISKSRDALQMSSAMFKWSLGDQKVDPTIGIGFTGLAAALESVLPGKKATLPPLPPPPTFDPPIIVQEQQPLPPVAWLERSSSTSLHARVDDPRPRTPSDNIPPLRQDSFGPPPASSSRQDVWRTQSHRSSESHSNRHTTHQPNGVSLHDSLMGDSSHSHNTVSRILDDHYDTYPNEGIYRKADIPSPTSATQRQGTTNESSLMSAVQQKQYRKLEHLLDSGSRADNKSEAVMLRIAAQNRDSESMAILLRHGLDPNGFDKQGFSPLYAATQLSFFEGARLLLKYGADPNLSAGPESESPLALAASENKVDLVEVFVQNGGDANSIMGNGNTALIRAITQTVSTQLVEHLLNSSGDANVKNDEGTTALFQAIQANRVDLLTILLDHGADPNLPGPKHPLWPATYKPKVLQLLLSRGADCKKTPGIMELAASLKRLESISILIQAGVSPNVRKDGVYTPLCSAIRDNSADIVSYLLEHGADPNLKASEYPAWKCITHHRLHFLPQLVTAGADLNNPKGIVETAVEHNDRDALVYLLSQGVNANDRNAKGHTALTTAIREGRADLVELLIAKGADPALRGEDWPLCMAVKQPSILKKLLAKLPNPRAFKGVIEMAVVANQLESIKLLLASGVSVEDKNCGVFSPLTTAIRERNKELTRYLLDVADADPNSPGEHLPLVKALRRYVPGDTEIIEMLLSRGADINRMHRGWNPVLQAVENGDAMILQLLIEKGGPVDLQVTDESGRPVVDIVTERGWEEGLSLLFPNAEARQ